MRLFKAFPSLKLNQIRETDDLSTPAVIEGVFEVHCDAASTELEATETDATTEAGVLLEVTARIQHRSVSTERCSVVLFFFCFST